MRYDRLDTIINILEDVKSINLNDLCEKLNVSKNTIRRDIAELEASGKIKKFYGGIRIATSNEPAPFLLRQTSNLSQKKYIAKLAATLVKPGDVIYIDSGTTTMHMVENLVGISNVTILTSSLNVMVEAAKYNLAVIGTGGNLYGPSNSFVGNSVIRDLSQYNFIKAFMSSTGISSTYGATNASPLESEIKKFVMTKSCKKNLLVDSSKFGHCALITFANLCEFNNVITDKKPTSDYCDYLNANNISLLI